MTAELILTLMGLAFSVWLLWPKSWGNRTTVT